MRIKNLRVKGIKNLEDEYIEFTNKTLDRERKSAIKLLYGNCGSGKTAILNAIDIYMGIVSKYEFIDKYNSYLKKIATNTIIKFEVDLLINTISLTHIIELRLHNGKFVIFHEEILVGKKKYYLYEKNNLTLNLIITNKYIFNDKASVLSHYFDAMYSLTNGVSVSEKFNMWHYRNGFDIYGFSKLLNSSYEIVTKKQLLIESKDGRRIVESGTEMHDNLEIYIPTLYEDLFYVGAIESFFKLMNKNIISVELYRKELGNDTCHEDILIKYKNREVFLSDESPGMKRLLELFLAIHKCNNSIVVLDDFDMYLSEKQSQVLLGYLVEHGNSQIIAVVQSTHLMSVVKHIPKAITIMDNGTVNTWRKNGNENPAKMFLSNKFVDETIDTKQMGQFFVDMKESYKKLQGLQPQIIVDKK